MSGRSRSYKADLYRSLENDTEALYYLQAALEDSQAAFLVALRNVAEARNLSKVARESSIDRAHLYRTLCDTGNPTISSLGKILHALGLRLAIDVDGANPQQEAVTEHVWHAAWHVPASRKRKISVYAPTGYNSRFRESSSPQPGIIGCEQMLGASAETCYADVPHPAYISEYEEDLCEMAY